MTEQEIIEEANCRLHDLKEWRARTWPEFQAMLDRQLGRDERFIRGMLD